MALENDTCILTPELSLYIAGLYHQSQLLSTPSFRLWCTQNLASLLNTSSCDWLISRNPFQNSDSGAALFSYQAQESGVYHALSFSYASLQPSSLQPNSETFTRVILFILPHLAESFRLNLLSNFYMGDKKECKIIAIFNSDGVMLEEDGGFSQLVKEKAFKLNRDSIKNLYSGESIFAASGIIVTVNKSDDYYLANAVDFGDDFKSLSPKELLVCYYISQGFKNNLIATKLNISQKTVENHLVKIYQKLGISSRAFLVRQLNSKNRKQLNS
ncbi:LuxR C-terminal-related transcriptional regulator [Parasalinivibrio latis]|uniref:response regulator transcription factor n=1 Tax=Parasalinivibrio latis TaxID=2952610 RepID=UPI0030E422D1